MATWTRRQFTALGITQYPVGPCLETLQRRFGGVAMLMIDVSGSMDGTPILNAAEGGRAFVQEAVAAHYKVGVMLWNTRVVALAEPTPDGTSALAILSTLNRASGGNALDGPLKECHRVLTPFSGDRVVALFGDGDLTPKLQVLALVSTMKADNIRFITRGLGALATSEFAEVSDEAPEAVRIESVDQLASGIASMASTLKSSGIVERDR